MRRLAVPSGSAVDVPLPQEANPAQPPPSASCGQSGFSRLHRKSGLPQNERLSEGKAFWRTSCAPRAESSSSLPRAPHLQTVASHPGPKTSPGGRAAACLPRIRLVGREDRPGFFNSFLASTRNCENPQKIESPIPEKTTYETSRALSCPTRPVRKARANPRSSVRHAKRKRTQRGSSSWSSAWGASRKDRPPWNIKQRAQRAGVYIYIYIYIYIYLHIQTYIVHNT